MTNHAVSRVVFPGLRRLLVVTVALVTVASGCSDDDGSASPTTPTGATTTTPTAPATTTTPTTTTPTTTTPTTPGSDSCSAPGLDQFAFVFNTAPTPGATVTSGFTASGCANAFEAAIAWRLEDRLGNELAEGFETASCGTGCVGTYSFAVEYSVAEPTMGRLIVFTSSARDGSAQDLNSIPLLLT